MLVYFLPWDPTTKKLVGSFVFPSVWVAVPVADDQNKMSKTTS